MDKMHIDTEHLKIQGKRVLLVWFWGNKNLGDELILIGTIRLLLKEGKQPIVVSQDPEFLKNFCAQFFDVSKVEFIYELPRGIRSWYRYFTKGYYQAFSAFYSCDAIILGGGEILTEENPNAYWYWRYSMWGALIRPKIKLYVMWGVQIPKKWYNRPLFNLLKKKVEKRYLRDFVAIEELKDFGIHNTEFFMDTSYFIVDDWSKYKKTEKSDPYIVVNLNSNAEKFFDQMVPYVQEYQAKGYKLYYVPICKGLDDDGRYLARFEQSGISMEVLDWEKDFDAFMHILANAEKVIGTRLHCFLVSRFLWAAVQVFPYQKKILKMQKVLSKLGI